MDSPATTVSPRLVGQMQFIIEIDRLKSILRQSLIADGSRNENDAEHSWHLATMAIVLAEYGPTGMDVGRVIRMALVHDLVEIYAGDTYCYDPAAVAGQCERERAAADRLFAMLEPDQAADLRGLWEEFEARQTPESKFAAALDRVQPILLNYHTQGKAWLSHGVTRAAAMERNRHIEAGATELWVFARGLIDDAVVKGYLLA